MSNYTFARYEEKYMLDRAQFEQLCEFFKDKTVPDEFPEYRVNNIYYDTSDYRIIRHSIEKPRYKEKLRLRYYGETLPQDGIVFLELKKKYRSIVYKRRILLQYNLIDEFLNCPASFLSEIVEERFKQVAEEMKFFLSTLNDISNQILISYKRTALVGEDDMRITFDNDILYNHEHEILPADYVIMELKGNSSMPLEYAKFFSEKGIFPVSFSKYKTAYIKHIFKGEKDKSLCLI